MDRRPARTSHALVGAAGSSGSAARYGRQDRAHVELRILDCRLRIGGRGHLTSTVAPPSPRLRHGFGGQGRLWWTGRPSPQSGEGEEAGEGSGASKRSDIAAVGPPALRYFA